MLGASLYLYPSKKEKERKGGGRERRDGRDKGGIREVQAHVVER